MKLLLIHRYFWPDAPPYGHMLLTMGKRFAQEGHEVDVFSTQPSYLGTDKIEARPAVETIDGVNVRRIRLLSEVKKQSFRRLLNTAIFLFRLALYLGVGKYDVVLFSTMPPVLLGLTVRWALKLRGGKTRYVYHCLDIYPELALHEGFVQDGWRYRFLRNIDKVTCRKAAAVVVLSKDMKETLLERGLASDRIHVINNFFLNDSLSGSLPALPARAPGDFIVIFAGNMGRFQSLETVIEAAHLLASEAAIQFWFLGEGLMKDELVRLSGELLHETVHFIPYQPPPVASQILRLSDLSLVALNRGIYRCAYPSKTLANLAAGCRLLVMMEAEGELVRMVMDNNLGSWCRQNDPEMLAAEIRKEAAQAGTHDRERLRQYAHRHFGPDTILDSWMEKIIEPLGGDE